MQDKVVTAGKTAALVVAGALGAEYIGKFTGNSLIGTAAMVGIGLFGVKGSMGKQLAAGALVPVVMDLAKRFVP